MKRFIALVVVALLAVLPQVRGQGVDDEYVRVYNLIQDADSLSEGGQLTQALARYVEAQTELQRLQMTNPEWNAAVVKFRLGYLESKIAALSAKAPAPGTRKPEAAGVKPSGTPAEPAKPTPPSDWESQLAALKEQVRSLQSETGSLESKLKEALAAQPAAMDPRELAKAQDKIKSLQKENELMSVALAQEKAKPAVTPNPKALDQAQAALAEANRKLVEQTARANSLAQEKLFLQNKLSVLAPSEDNAPALAATRQALAEANAKLAQQTLLATKLGLEKDALQTRLKSVGNPAQANALLAENALLKKELADLRTATPAQPQGDVARQLAEARAQIAALQSDREILRLEKMALESRMKQVSGTAVAKASVSPAPAASQPEDARLIKLLQQERDDLQKKLDAAIREHYGHRGQETAAHVEELEKEVATLRSRLEVFEARTVPYTTEELALFEKPEAKLSEPDPKAGKKSVKELPPGTIQLVADAHKHFASHQLDQAEREYLQVLAKDPKNVYTLGNLAAIQLERGRLDEAEKNIKQALAIAPDDVFSLCLLGQLRFRQEKYQDALDTLTRAAKLDPQNAEIQNYLGVTLSQMGMRGPAETALRKAIQLEPGYGGAHHNLAVIYLTQKPPMIELARWHYQKALAAGHPRNPDLEKMFEVRGPVE
ncbi:Tetratricopeptide TPR_2 repeat protein [Verrucomicrobia bacterium]|nr:Tetratricopeptide TPR_2 repeat protein [Verrucomicrobiota bacterium]